MSDSLRAAVADERAPEGVQASDPTGVSGNESIHCVVGSTLSTQVRSRSFRRRQQRKAAAERKQHSAPETQSSDTASVLTKSLCEAALRAKAAYELAYETAELRGGSELSVIPRGGESSIGELALQAITHCDILVDALLGRSSGLAAESDQAMRASATSLGVLAHVDPANEDLPDWLLSAAMELGTSVQPDAKRRLRRTRKTDD